VIDGHSIGTGSRKRKDAVLQAHKDSLKYAPNALSRKLYKKYLQTERGRQENYGNFQGWLTENPPQIAPYREYVKHMSDRLKQIITSRNIPVAAVDFLPLLQEILRTIKIHYTTNVRPGLKKLGLDDYRAMAAYLGDSDAIGGVIERHLRPNRPQVSYNIPQSGPSFLPASAPEGASGLFVEKERDDGRGGDWGPPSSSSGATSNKSWADD
jgi:hypothetical protein